MPKVVKQRQKKTRVILLSTLAVIVVAGVLYFLFARGPAPEQAITQNAPGLTPPSPSATKAPTEAKPPAPEAEEPAAAPALPTKAPTAATAEDSCQEVSDHVTDFFSRLDQRPYMSFYKLHGGSERHFAKVLKKLFAHPPVVARETDSLFTILQNAAHFYRVLGRNDVFLIKDILKGEQEDIEPTMADFYRLSLMEGKCGHQKQAIALPLKGLYEYAGFFLNTMGGQSYLFRRSPRVRTLTKYYSVLVIDRANNQGLNKYGIDIRPVINSLIEEMEATRNLASRKKYLRTLRNLKVKYQARYGD